MKINSVARMPRLRLKNRLRLWLIKKFKNTVINVKNRYNALLPLKRHIRQ
jgi:hypothetical protein